MAVADGHTGQVGIGSDRVAARVELLAGRGIESVQRGMGGGPSVEGKDDSVGDRRRRRVYRDRARSRPGSATGCPSFSSTLNATMLPCGAGPLVAANFAGRPARRSRRRPRRRRLYPARWPGLPRRRAWRPSTTCLSAQGSVMIGSAETMRCPAEQLPSLPGAAISSLSL